MTKSHIKDQSNYSTLVSEKHQLHPRVSTTVLHLCVLQTPGSVGFRIPTIWTDKWFNLGVKGTDDRPRTEVVFMRQRINWWGWGGMIQTGGGGVGGGA